MSLWKLLGLAGLVGVAGVVASKGVVAVRRRRTWSEIEPDELRQRLHDRLAAANAGSDSGSGR